ncbi:MAG: hypothetical protein IT168_26305 [Bryobacterales bacterium]|nr:hypothetical protein [Bryobacterales bacterium]
MQHSRTTLIKSVTRTMTFALALLGSTLMAHGGFEHVMGTVSKIGPTTVTVETTDKKMVEVVIDAKTKFSREDKAATVSDMKAGDRVMIDAKPVDKKLVADSVKLGTAASKGTAAKGEHHQH